MKELVELAKEIETKEQVVLEYIDTVEFYDGQLEEIYYLTDPIYKRTERTITLVLIKDVMGKISFVASIGLSQIPIIKYHTHEHFHKIITQQKEYPVDITEIYSGAIDVCLNFADVYHEWLRKLSKTEEGIIGCKD